MTPEPAERSFTVTVGRGQQAIGLERRTLSLDDLWGRLSHFEVAAKGQGECIIPGDIAECPEICRQHGKHGADCGGGKIHRLAANVRTVELLFLDCDDWDEAELSEALERIDATGYRYLCYSSASYTPPEKCKVRLVFPLAAPYIVKDTRLWRESVWPALVKLVGVPDADTACSDVSRLYYLPTKRNDSALLLLVDRPGKLLEVPALPERREALHLVEPLAPRPTSSAELLAQLRAETDHPDYVELVERVAAGQPLATDKGARHPAITRVTWLLAALNPRPSLAAAIELLRPSLEAMGDERDFVGEAERAFEGAADKVPQDIGDFRARLEEQRGTDQAFASRLARTSKDAARFLPGVGWFVWDGKRYASWGDQPLGLVTALRPGYEADHLELQRRVREIDQQLKDNGPAATVIAQDWVRRLAEKRNKLSDKAEKFYKTCIRPTQNASSSGAILRMAENLTPFRAEPDALDADPFALNCANGLLDLRTGALRPHDPAALCTKLAPVAYDPGAAAPLFTKVLADALPDTAVRAFFQRVVGYALTGDVSEHLMFLLLGSGGNGKSTLLNAIAATLGDYAGVAPKTIILSAHRNSVPKSHELADLRGQRFVQVMEPSEREHLDTSRLKSVVGGDLIKADRKYEHSITFPMQGKLFLACNSLPRVTDDDNGPWRRIALIEFPNMFLIDPDRSLPDRLRAESAGILAWAVRGAQEWQRQGLAVPAVCRRAVEDYRESENDVASFVAECVERGEGTYRARLLYRAYQDWTKYQAVMPMSEVKFSRRLEKLGFARLKRNDGNHWGGIKSVRTE